MTGMQEIITITVNTVILSMCRDFGHHCDLAPWQIMANQSFSGANMALRVMVALNATEKLGSGSFISSWTNFFLISWHFDPTSGYSGTV